MKKSPDLMTPLLVSLTLGLAPFTPEPHLVEKLRMIATGVPLAAIDVFDVLMHGAPWVWLAWAVVQRLRGGAPTAAAATDSPD